MGRAQRGPAQLPVVEGPARRGFNLSATANDRDRGVNDLSSALRRRFNTVVLPVPGTAEEEVDIDFALHGPHGSPARQNASETLFTLIETMFANGEATPKPSPGGNTSSDDQPRLRRS